MVGGGPVSLDSTESSTGQPESFNGQWSTSCQNPTAQMNIGAMMTTLAEPGTNSASMTSSETMAAPTFAREAKYMTSASNGWGFVHPLPLCPHRVLICRVEFGHSTHISFEFVSGGFHLVRTQNFRDF